MAPVMLVLIFACASVAHAQEVVPFGEVVEAEALVAVGAQAEDKYAEGASGGAYVYLADKQMEPGQAPIENGAIAISNGKIVAVGPAITA